jgi:hypothetical protein
MPNSNNERINSNTVVITRITVKTEITGTILITDPTLITMSNIKITLRITLSHLIQTMDPSRIIIEDLIIITEDIIPDETRKKIIVTPLNDRNKDPLTDPNLKAGFERLKAIIYQ